jgi:hypothetical protein
MVPMQGVILLAIKINQQESEKKRFLTLNSKYN